MSTAKELDLNPRDIVRVVPSKMGYKGLDDIQCPLVAVLGVDIRGDPRYGRRDSYTRVVYLEDSPDGKKSGVVVDLEEKYEGFIPPVLRNATLPAE